MKKQLFVLLTLVPHLVLAQNGVAGRDSLLMGFHFGQHPRSAPATELGTELNFDEFTRYLPEDLPYLSYGDFWVGWSDIERYKGDEKGLALLDRAVAKALGHGMKVKLVLIHSTWWTHDLDWTRPQILAIGPKNLEDWDHWCALMGSHFRGRVAQWDLQGEANGKDYWPFETLETVQEHVHESYRVGCRAFRRVAPESLVGISCATPGTEGIDIYDQKISRAQLDRWYDDNLLACKGLFDTVPINYFSDVTWADPYGGGFVFYKSIRNMLDKMGLRQVELGSGESSINWADSSYDFKKYGLSIPVQARRLNETLGATFDDGMNKWIFHGIPQAPGFGWVWRWGFRKYEDFWGIWPAANKVPGTRIVWRYENPDGRKVDYGPAFARPSDPYLPSWEIWKFWAQATPPRSEAVRLPVKVSHATGTVWRLGSFLAKRNSAAVLVYNEQPAPLELTIDAARTGWPDSTRLDVTGHSEQISFETGEHTVSCQVEKRVQVKAGEITVTIPITSGWTTLNLKPESGNFDAEFAGATFPTQAQAGKPVVGQFVLRNTGRKAWGKAEQVSVKLWTDGRAVSPMSFAAEPLTSHIQPGESGCFRVILPAVDQPQLKTWSARLVHRAGNGSSQSFGPVFQATSEIVDDERPRKLIANRELGHIRIKWFAPAGEEAATNVRSYELYRSEQGTDATKRLIQTLSGTEYIDTMVKPDRVYQYEVTALDKVGRRSFASNSDGARALGTARLWDAEITAHTIPAEVRRGEPRTVSITLCNTGLKEWDLRPDSGQRVYLQTVQLWGENNEGWLPQLGLGEPRVVESGQSITLSFPYVGPSAGRFENHWVMRLDAKGGSGAWFGTPLRVETRVIGL